MRLLDRIKSAAQVAEQRKQKKEKKKTVVLTQRASRFDVFDHHAQRLNQLNFDVRRHCGWTDDAQHERQDVLFQKKSACQRGA